MVGRSDWALDASLLIVNIYETRRLALDFSLYDLIGDRIGRR